MSYSKKSIIDASLRIATMAGFDANTSPVVDNAVVMEDLYVSAMRQSIETGAKMPSEVGGLKQDYPLTIASGTTTFPPYALDSFMDDSAVYAEGDDTISKWCSWTPRYYDFLNPAHPTNLGYYTVQNGTFLFREPGGDANDYNGDIHLVTIGVPLSTTFTSTIDISFETAERAIIILASMLQGAKPVE